MKVNIVGMGYIGLPTALSLAAGGVKVTGTDKNTALLDTLRSGKLTLIEVSCKNKSCFGQNI